MCHGRNLHATASSMIDIGPGLLLPANGRGMSRIAGRVSSWGRTIDLGGWK
jgi:hypothetical protein